jgi:hypothetical protein
VEKRFDSSTLLLELREIEGEPLPRQVQGDEQESPAEEQHESRPRPPHRRKVPNRDLAHAYPSHVQRLTPDMAVVGGGGAYPAGWRSAMCFAGVDWTSESEAFPRARMRMLILAPTVSWLGEISVGVRPCQRMKTVRRL